MRQWQPNSTTSVLHASYFQQIRKVSATVTKLGYTIMIFIEPGTKINRQYYQELILMQELLPVIYSIAGDVFVFQQDSAPKHRAHDTSRFCGMRHPIH